MAAASAYSIPGYTEPYDPPNYYSKTSISYPDSRPSFFALRELMRGSVYDYTRHLKSIIFGDDFNSVYAQIFDQIVAQVINMTGMEDWQAEMTKGKIDDIFIMTNTMSFSSSVPEAGKQNLFRFMDSKQDPHNEQLYNEYNQSTWMNSIYQQALQSIRQSNEDSIDRMQTIEDILQNSANSKGEMEVLQSSTQLHAINTQETMRKNSVLGNMATIEAVHQRYETDRQLRDTQRNKDGLTIRVGTVKDEGDIEKIAPGWYIFWRI